MCFWHLKHIKMFPSKTTPKYNSHMNHVYENEFTEVYQGYNLFDLHFIYYVSEILYLKFIQSLV